MPADVLIDANEMCAILLIGDQLGVMSDVSTGRGESVAGR